MTVLHRPIPLFPGIKNLRQLDMDIEQNKIIKPIHDSVSCQSEDKCLYKDGVGGVHVRVGGDRFSFRPGRVPGSS